MIFLGELQGIPCNNLASRFRSGPTPRYAGRDDAPDSTYWNMPLTSHCEMKVLIKIFIFAAFFKLVFVPRVWPSNIDDMRWVQSIALYQYPVFFRRSQWLL